MFDFFHFVSFGTATLTFLVPLYKCCSIGLELSCGSNAFPLKNGFFMFDYFQSFKTESIHWIYFSKYNAF